MASEFRTEFRIGRNALHSRNTLEGMCRSRI